MLPVGAASTAGAAADGPIVTTSGFADGDAAADSGSSAGAVAGRDRGIGGYGCTGPISPRGRGGAAWPKMDRSTGSASAELEPSATRLATSIARIFTDFSLLLHGIRFLLTIGLD